MSILVKRMEMPDDCRNCPFETYYFNCGETKCRATGKILADFYKPIPFDGRDEECPLVQLSDHGMIISELTLLECLERIREEEMVEHELQGRDRGAETIAEC